MFVAATFVSTLIAVQGFAPEKLFKCSTKPTEALAPLRATHYDSIAEIRQVKVILFKLCYDSVVGFRENLSDTKAYIIWKSGITRRHENAQATWI